METETEMEMEMEMVVSHDRHVNMYYAASNVQTEVKFAVHAICARACNTTIMHVRT